MRVLAQNVPCKEYLYKYSRHVHLQRTIYKEN